MQNDTDELEERVQILELEMDNVENHIEILENEDSILDVRITDAEQDIEGSFNFLFILTCLLFCITNHFTFKTNNILDENKVCVSHFRSTVQCNGTYQRRHCFRRQNHKSGRSCEWFRKFPFLMKSLKNQYYLKHMHHLFNVCNLL